MSEQHGGNGNGKKPHAAPERTALEEVTARIEERQAEEARSGVAAGEDIAADESPAQWREIGKPLTLEVLQEGLIEVATISEAAIEGGIKMASDLQKAMHTQRLNSAAIEQTSSQVKTIASKLEAGISHVHQVDDHVAKLTKTVNVIRRDVQFIKDTVIEMQGPVGQIPAIKELLGEILSRLPEPKKPRRKKKTL